MTHWDAPSWDDAYGDPHTHTDPDDGARPAQHGRAGGGRHAADGGGDWFGLPQRPVSPPRGSGPPPAYGQSSPAPSSYGPPAGYGQPEYGTPPARPVSPPAYGRPVSPARPLGGYGAPPPPPPPPPPPLMQRPVSPAGRPVSPYRAAPDRPISGPSWSASRSHWVDESGVDHRGRRIIDADDIDDDEDEHEDSRFNRRLALLALGGVVGGTAIVLSPQGLDLARKLFGGPADAPEALSHDNLPGDGSERPAGRQPSTARTYTDQNESYMGSSGGDQLRQNTPQQGSVQRTPAQAAQVAPASPSATPVPVSASGTDPVRHLASRVTFGATPKLIADINRMGIDAWLGLQLEPEKIPDTRAEQKLAELTTLNKSIDQLRADRDANGQKNIHPDDEVIEAAIARQIWSDRQLFEVMVDFWNDFLHVGPYFDGSDVQRPSFDRDVIRKYALDNYPDMFVAANRHPALLTYLNQNQSTKNAVNENLARENLELYSVGVDGGYTEKDVRQAALLQTGRSVRDDKYFYRADQHFVGPITIMGFSHPNDTAAGGEKAAEDYFRYLALHPSTARYIALNLCTRLVSDTPPASLVDQVAAAYLANQGKVKPMLVTLLSSTLFWGSVGLKFRRPGEYLASIYRTLGVMPDTPAGFNNNDPNASPFLRGLRGMRDKLEELGHFPTGQPTPNGYPDVFVAWTSAGTMVNMWNETMSVIEGRRSMFTYVAPEQILGTAPPATAGEYVDALTQRLVHAKFSTKDRDLILSVAGVPATARVDASFNGAIKAVIRTILASPHQHLR